MVSNPKTRRPMFQKAPDPKALAEQQAASLRLAELNAWTEVPNNPPPAELAASIVPPPQAITPSPLRMRPWEGEDALRAHPYQLICTEVLFQKIDFCWKRTGHKSMKEWTLKVLEQAADEQILKIETGGGQNGC